MSLRVLSSGKSTEQSCEERRELILLTCCLPLVEEGARENVQSRHLCGAESVRLDKQLRAWTAASSVSSLRAVELGSQLKKPFFLLGLPLSLSHTYTHAHTYSMYATGICFDCILLHYSRSLCSMFLKNCLQLIYKE